MYKVTEIIHNHPDRSNIYMVNLKGMTIAGKREEDPILTLKLAHLEI